ncbi:hypothetical protein VP01_251g3 [Puccinia sorghi]|uniref:Vacuolar import and degradation protein 27 n=1 Tax=Puccinia sorghi TaxID=27349 RepID=A0A0L6V5E0_9BASI|nr:hypothetical protein VP01_251g3 [Puccinia sorghi]
MRSRDGSSLFGCDDLPRAVFRTAHTKLPNMLSASLELPPPQKVSHLCSVPPIFKESTPEGTLELISLPAGRLNIIRPKHSTKVQKECIYLEGELVLRRTSLPFHYQLVIKRLGEDTEEPFENEDVLEDDYEKAFLLAVPLDFRMYEAVDESDEEERLTIAFSWLDLSSPESFERFEFVISSQREDCSLSEVERVVDVVTQCIWEDENEKDSSEAPEEELVAIKQRSAITSTIHSLSSPSFEFRLPPPLAEITFPAQSSRVIRAPSASPSDDSDVEQSADTTLDFSQSSQVSLAPSVPNDHADVNKSLEMHPDEAAKAVQQDYENDSDSSADEIVNQLRGTSLADKPKGQSASVPIHGTSLGTPSRTQEKHPVSPSPQATGTSSTTYPASSAKVQSPAPLTKRVPYPSIVPAKSPILTSRSRESTPERKHEDNPSIPASPSADSQANSSSLTDRQQDLEAAQDCELLPHPPVREVEDESSDPLTVSAWESICDLYLFDPAVATFNKHELGVMAQLWVSAPDNPRQDICWLTVSGKPRDPTEDPTIISTAIGDDKCLHNLNFSSGTIFFNYNYSLPGSEDTEVKTWALRFRDDDVTRDQYTAAQEAFAKALYDREHGLGSYEAQDRANKEWSRLTYGVAIEGGPDEEDDAQSDGPEEAEEDEEEGQWMLQLPFKKDWAIYASSDDEDNAQLREFRSKQSGPKNSCSAIGVHENLTAVTRDNMVGIFMNESTSDQKLNNSTHVAYMQSLRFMATIPELKTPDGTRNLQPVKVMMHAQDSVLVIQDALNQNGLYKCDLTRGQVVEEWKTNQEETLQDFFHRVKVSPTVAESTLLGTSRKAIFEIDPRLSGRQVGAIKEYKTDVDFSCGTTTASGQVAIGSNKGIVRLYIDKIGGAAKAELPQGRNPILHLDVTNSGRYVVATCQTYLLLFDVQHNDGKLGFEKRFLQTEKPKAVRVEITPEHQAQIAGEKIPFCFKGAKFNRGDGNVEKNIVTSIGPYIITFDLKSILNNRTKYTVKRYQENVVADNFRWNHDKDIVVTLESDVILEKRTRLSKPTRESIIGSVDVNQSPAARRTIRTGRSTMGVVQEWDE